MTNTPYHKAPSLDPIVDQLGLEVRLDEAAVIEVQASLDPYQASSEPQPSPESPRSDHTLLDQPVVEKETGMVDVGLGSEPQLEQEPPAGGVPWSYCKYTVDNCREHYEDLNVKKFFITYFLCFVLTYGFTIMIQGGLGIPIYIYRGFDMDDLSLSYPHMSSRVGGNTNIVLTLAVTLMMFAMKAASEPDYERKDLDSKTELSFTVVCMLKSLLNLKFLFDILIMLYGNIVMNFLTNSLKSLSGVLKPHFIQMCMMNRTIVDQLRAEGTSYVNETLTETICTNTEFADYRRSFPSGHTTQASYCMVMAILAIQAMRVKPEYSALRSLGQLFCAIYVSFISFDRIKDHHHNWEDVLAGVFIGSGVALAFWYGYIADLSYRDKGPDKSESMSELCVSEPFLDKKSRKQHMSSC